MESGFVWGAVELIEGMVITSKPSEYFFFAADQVRLMLLVARVVHDIGKGHFKLIEQGFRR